MGHYKVIKEKDEEGRTIRRWIEPVGVKRPVADIPKPDSATLKGGKKKMVQCTACEVETQTVRKFKTRAMVAKHFKKSHDNLYMTKDSWRKYARDLEE